MARWLSDLEHTEVKSNRLAYNSSYDKVRCSPLDDTIHLSTQTTHTVQLREMTVRTGSDVDLLGSRFEVDRTSLLTVSTLSSLLTVFILFHDYDSVTRFIHISTNLSSRFTIG